MADKTIGQLAAASQVTPTDLFVLEQSGTAKKLTGQILENWLVSMADGHGGIQTIEKTGTAGLVDTYTITFADTTTATFTVTNGKAISSVTTYYAVSTSGSTVPSSWSTTRQSMTATNRYLWSYQHIAFNGGTPNYVDTVKTVIGVYGDKGVKGDTGRGISSMAQTSRTPGKFSVYTFTMSDGTTESFTVYDGVGISSIAKTSSVGLRDIYTITYTNGSTTTFEITNPKSITSVALTGTSGLVDTYTITFNDLSTTTFEVTNGSSIDRIQKTSTSGLVDTYTVTLTDGSTTNFTVTNAKSISSVSLVSGTHAPGTTDTYRITFNNGDTTNFTVYNGANGTGSVSTVDGIAATGQNVPLLLTGNGAPTSSTVAQRWQRYFDLTNRILYICVNISSGTPATYTWYRTSGSIDSALSSTSTNPVQNKVITGKVGTATLQTTSKNLSGAVNELKTAVDAKAPVASPALTGTPTAPTASRGTNTQQLATTAFVNNTQANLAEIETDPATSSHAVGDWIVYNGQLYIVTTAISIGESLSGKISATTAESRVAAVSQQIAPIVRLAESSSHTTRSIHIPSNRRLMIAIASSSPSSSGLYFVASSASGVVSFSDIKAVADTTLTGGTNQLTVASPSRTLVFYIMMITGVITDPFYFE